MDAKTRMEFKKMFEEERNQILNHRVSDESLHLNPDDRADEADLCRSEIDQNLQFRLRSRTDLYLKKIDAALGRIADGSFGECLGCGVTIDQERLKARPTTTLCIDCKEEQEKKENWHFSSGKRVQATAPWVPKLATESA